MAIEVNDVGDLADWALSKACHGWRANRECIDRDTGVPLEEPHPGCLYAQRAHDLLSKIDRYEGEDVVGWLVEDTALDLDIW